MWSMEIQRLHFFYGMVVAISIAAAVYFAAPTVWKFQAHAIGVLLAMAGVPFNLDPAPASEVIEMLGGVHYLIFHPSGPTFVVPVNFVEIDATWAAIGVFVSIGIGYLVFRSGLTLPLKMLALLIIVLVVVTLIYNVFVSAAPPHDLRRLSLDWQFSGALVATIIGFTFAMAIFPLRGPLWIKIQWTLAALLFSTVWNIARISVVLATLFYTKSILFLLLHYFLGVFVDFLYVIAIYSLALGHLAKHETSETGWTKRLTGAGVPASPGKAPA